MIPAFFVFLSNTGGSTLLNDATNIMNQASATCSADDRGENQMKDATRENPAKTTHTDLKRKMEVRHLRMISLGGVIGVYGQINVYGVTTKSERHKRSYWTRTADGNGIGGRKAPVPYGS